MKAILSILVLLLTTTSVLAATPMQRMQQLVDYVGVDYQAAVSSGIIASEVEYAEMLDFSNTIQMLAADLPEVEGKKEIISTSKHLQDLVKNKADGSQVAATSGELRQLLINSYDLAVTPTRVPDLQQGSKLFASQCAGCHGVEGKGDGFLGKSLEPAPTNFTDLDRYRQRTLHGLYSTITHGVAGTGMKSYAQLTDDERWSLAFYVGQLAPSEQMRVAGKASLLVNGKAVDGFGKSLFTTMTPAEVENKSGVAAVNIISYLRGNPDLVFGQAETTTLTFARQKLDESRAAYAQGDSKTAHELAVTAYLEGFELVEGNLDTVDHELRLQIESGMTAFRGLIKNSAPLTSLDDQVKTLHELLSNAEQKLIDTELSGSTAFVSALMILLREGLEAILVLAALAAFLIKTGRRDGLRYLYMGTAAAFALGVVTWYVSSHVVQIGGAERELTEGFAALFAAAMLFYVGFWLHSKTGAAQWKAFIQGSVKKALSQGTLWGLSGLAFIAVYREIFETVLFYQALWLQTSESGQGMILSGFIVASALLVLLGWLILRFSTRLPLRQFFSVTSVFMFVLAIVFAGKGIAALQEAGKLPVNIVSFPRIDLLGIYPNLEGLGVQLGLVLLAGYLLWKSKRQSSHLSRS